MASLLTTTAVTSTTRRCIASSPPSWPSRRRGGRRRRGPRVAGPWLVIPRPHRSDDWLEPYGRTLNAKILAGYDGHVRPHVGPEVVDRIDARRILTLRATSWTSRRTTPRRRALRLVRQVMGWAVVVGRLTSNPADVLGQRGQLLPSQRRHGDVRPLTPEQAKASGPRSWRPTGHSRYGTPPWSPSWPTRACARPRPWSSGGGMSSRTACGWSTPTSTATRRPPSRRAV